MFIQLAAVDFCEQIAQFVSNNFKKNTKCLHHKKSETSTLKRTNPVLTILKHAATSLSIIKDVTLNMCHKYIHCVHYFFSKGYNKTDERESPQEAQPAWENSSLGLF